MMNTAVKGRGLKNVSDVNKEGSQSRKEDVEVFIRIPSHTV